MCIQSGVYKAIRVDGAASVLAMMYINFCVLAQSCAVSLGE
ncbi:hypothetical protein [Orrella marina]|nr:hypothetical protein [Orrella marina]